MNPRCDSVFAEMAAPGRARKAAGPLMYKWGRHRCRPHSHRLLSPGHRFVRSREVPFQSSITRRSRRNRSRQAVGPVHAPFRSAWRFRGRKIRGGPMLHPIALRPKPLRLRPLRAGHSRPPATCSRVSFTGSRVHPKIFANPLASKSRSFRHRVETFLLFRHHSGLAAFLILVRPSGFDGLMMCLKGESHKVNKPDLSTFGVFVCG